MSLTVDERVEIREAIDGHLQTLHRDIARSVGQAMNLAQQKFTSPVVTTFATVQASGLDTVNNTVDVVYDNDPTNTPVNVQVLGSAVADQRGLMVGIPGGGEYFMGLGVGGGGGTTGFLIGSADNAVTAPTTLTESSGAPVLGLRWGVTAPTIGAAVGTMFFGAFNSADGLIGHVATIDGYAAGDLTAAGDYGGGLVFNTTPLGSSAPAENVRVSPTVGMYSQVATVLAQNLTITSAAQMQGTGGQQLAGVNALNGTPLDILYNADVAYAGVNALDVNPYTFNSWTNPWFAAAGVTGDYGTVPQGPRAVATLEGTIQWEHNANLTGGPGLFFTWFTFKNKSGSTANIGGNVLWQLQYNAMADGKHIGVAAIPDVQAPNIATEYQRTSFQGWWGYIDNPWFGTLNGGQLDAPTGESVGFMGLAMFMGNTQWGHRYDFMVREAWMKAGVQGQTAITPTLSTHVGMYMEPLTAAATNISLVLNNGIQAFDKDRTFTTAPFSGLGGFVPGGVYHSFQNKFTLNFANAAMGVLFGFQGTVELAHTANSLGLMSHYLDGGTYQNKSGVTAHLNDIDFLLDQPTFKANNATINLGHPRFALINPTFTVAGTGTFTAFSQWTDIESNSTVAAGALLTNRFGYVFNDAATGALGSGRITNQYAIYIPRLFGADKNVGIWNASATVYDAYSNTLASAAAVIEQFATVIYLNNTSGGPLTLTSTPTIPAAAEGQILKVVNVSANSVTVQDSGTLPGSLLKLRDPSGTRTIPQYASIEFIYNTFFGGWIETNYSTTLGGTAILSSAFTAKGDLLAGTGSGTYAVRSIPGGDNGFALVADSAQTTGLNYRPAILVDGTTIASTVDSSYRLVQATYGLTSEGFGTVPAVTLARANGTLLSSTATASGNVLGQWNVGGYQTTTSAWNFATGYLRGVATQAFTSTANGTRWELAVTANGATSPTQAVVLDQDATFGIGTSTTGTSNPFFVKSNGLTSLAKATFGTVSAGVDFLDIANAATITMNAAGLLNIGAFVAPTVTYAVAPGLFATPWIGFADNSTHQAATGSAGLMTGTYISFFAEPVLKTQDTNAQTISDYDGIQITPSLSVAGGGALTVTALNLFRSGGVTVPTGATVTDLRGLQIDAPTITGPVTRWTGINIPAVTGAGTNVGIKNLSALLQQGGLVFTPTTVTVTANAGTVPVTASNATFTNSSAAAMTITLATTGASNGQVTIVRVYDATNVVQNITWVNTENSGATVPATSNASTTQPKTVVFMFNSGTSKWRCIISV